MRRLVRNIINLFAWLFSLGFALAMVGGVAAYGVFQHYNKDLPAYDQLAKYDPATVTRLYAADGKLMAEYATEKRVFVPLAAIPKRVQNAFLAAEDKNFYSHTGIDITGLARAVRDNVANYGMGKSLVGGSTITQQVVKNFLLTSEKSLERKIKEAILAIRISEVYSKDKILELYLNEIYLGLGSYGVATAAQNYFNKSLDDLTVEEAALLAAQPKGPSLYNPRRNYEAAFERRNWVIDLMADAKFISTEEAKEAKAIPITLRNRNTSEVARADFFAEEVRRTLADMYGSNVLYEGGLVVKTTLNPTLQKAADAALQKALIEYDRRRGFRGPLAHLPSTDGWKEKLAKLTEEHSYHLLENQRLGVVSALTDKKAHLMFADDSQGEIPYSSMKWTRLIIADGKLGPEVKKPGDILKLGDVVIAGPLQEDQKKLLSEAEQKKSWDLEQVPEINGAMVVMDPHTGRVLAMAGGYAYGGTEFNRATQAKRQPGSSFKPFVYMAGLENGFTPSTIILDAPVEMSQGAGLPAWKPQNYHDEYLGPTTMRVGLEKSRNTMTVRLTQAIGISKVLDIGRRFHIYDDPPRNFSIVLGSAETTLMRLCNAYSSFAAGGKRNMPSLIERIDDRHGKTIYRRDARPCANCKVQGIDSVDTSLPPPMPEDNREQIVDPRINYQIVSILEGAALRGTGARAHAELKKTVAGKTGTTNDSLDTWFIGFSPDLVAGVFVGYDKPRTMGKRETGASVALPAFIDFMKVALDGKPDQPFRIPRGIRLSKVSLATGEPGTEGRIIDEAFISGGPIFIPGNGVDPKTVGTLSDTPATASPDGTPAQAPSLPPVMGTGGLY